MMLVIREMTMMKFKHAAAGMLEVVVVVKWSASRQSSAEVDPEY
jgi:hypothetical protein